MSRTPPTPLTLSQGWWLFAAASAALLPLLAYLPAWLTAAAATSMLWRAWLLWRAARLPVRSVLVLLVILGCATIWLQYRSLFGRDPGIAMLVLFLTLKLLELRSVRDGMAVILLGCFLLVTSFFFSQSMLHALLVGLALVVIITALGRLHAASHDSSVRRQLRFSALLLLQALPFMLILFLLFPRIQGPLWGLPQDAFSTSTGLSEQMRPGSVSRLVQSDAIAFRVRFEGTPPPVRELYWRAQVLNEFDGVEWSYRPGVVHERLPYNATGRSIDYTITQEASNQRWLFALEKAGLLPPDTVFTADQQILSRTPVRARLRYDMRSYPDFQPPAAESARILRAALQLPAATNPRTRALAQGWRDQGGGDAAILERAITYFRMQPLAYTLTPPLMIHDSVDAFLFEHRRGFCEHYASAFAFALRAAGVPARIVGGYQGGELNPVDGYLTVRQYDAHAWVEVWIGGRGWLRIDPTATSIPRRIDDGLAFALDSTAALPLLARGDYPWLRELRHRWDAVSNAWNQRILGFNATRQEELLRQLGMPDPDWQRMTAWLAGLCGILLLGLTAFALYQRPALDPATRQWHKFLRKLQRHGVPLAPWMGPETVAAVASAQMPQHACAIRDIAQTYVALRYQQPISSGLALEPLRRKIARFSP